MVDCATERRYSRIYSHRRTQILPRKYAHITCDFAFTKFGAR